MNAIEQRLQSELRLMRERIRQIGGHAAIGEAPGVIGEDGTLADNTDVGRANEDREMSFAAWGRLVEKANRLAQALERLRSGDYGACQECGEPINPRRLEAVPEATTCVRCQDRLERTSARSGREERGGLESQPLE